MVKPAKLPLSWPKTCPVIFAQRGQAPTVANPGQAHRVLEFNQRVGLDVKYLPGRKPNQKISALNIVDYASVLSTHGAFL